MTEEPIQFRAHLFDVARVEREEVFDFALEDCLELPHLPSPVEIKMGRQQPVAFIRPRQCDFEEQARVAQEIDANVRQSLARGTVDLWKRLQDMVSHMVDRLNEPESRFHASLVSNVLDQVNLLPELNVGEDAELNRFAGEIRNKLCGFTSRDLKTNDVLRVAAANDAAALLYEMDAVLREPEQRPDSTTEGDCPADHIFSHMSAYMEATSQ